MVQAEACDAGMPVAERRVSRLNSTVRVSVPVKCSTHHPRSEMRFPGGNDDSGNGRVAHDVLADAALGREPDAASAACAHYNQVGALLFGDATDTFANVLHCFASYFVLQLHDKNKRQGVKLDFPSEYLQQEFK